MRVVPPLPSEQNAEFACGSRFGDWRMNFSARSHMRLPCRRGETPHAAWQGKTKEREAEAHGLDPP